MKRVVISRPETGDEVNLSLFRRGFTLGELSIVLVVMTLVVMVTLPITLSKMKKVDYYSYYMGYNAVKSISANVIPGFFKEEDDGCAFVLGGVCFSAPFPAPAVSKSECEELKTELEIEVCYFENDYWVGALKLAGAEIKCLLASIYL